MQAMSVQAEKMPMVVVEMLDKLDWTPLPAPAEPVGEDPYPTHQGVIEMGGMLPGKGQLHCYKLSDGRRVFDARDIGLLFTLLGGVP